MKVKKKPKGTKARVQAYKKRLAYIGRAITGATLIVITAISGFLIYSHSTSSPNQTSNQQSRPKAAIVDHLSLTAPNRTFIQTATNTLKQAGYAVDYYSSDEVTIELYRNLPSKDYKLIFLRVHSGNNQYDQGPIFLWTSEPYSRSKYVYEQLTDQLRPTSSLKGDSAVFCIGPEFVRRSMRGQFQNAIVIGMGCETMKDTDLAKAFIEKGASIFIGWTEDVVSSHTDQATACLIKYVITHKQTIKQAVAEAMKKAGPDPACESLLVYYPLEAED